jgi:outer membrane protein TolC
LLRRRPDIRRAERDVAAQSELIGVAKADLFPAFSISGTFGFTASDFSSWYDGKSFNGFGGPAFQWNLLNYGRLTNNVRAQDALFQQLAVDYQNIVLRAYQEVEDSVVGYLREQDRVAFLAESVKASRRSVDLSLAQYREGAADYQRVLDSQSTLVNAQNNLARSQGDVSLNLIATFKSLGGGWQIREGKDFVPAAIKKEMEERTNWGDLLQAKEVEDPPEWLPDAPAPF